MKFSRIIRYIDTFSTIKYLANGYTSSIRYLQILHFSVKMDEQKNQKRKYVYEYIYAYSFIQTHTTC